MAEIIVALMSHQFIVTNMFQQQKPTTPDHAGCLFQLKNAKDRQLNAGISP